VLDLVREVVVVHGPLLLTSGTAATALAVAAGLWGRARHLAWAASARWVEIIPGPEVNPAGTRRARSARRRSSSACDINILLNSMTHLAEPSLVGVDLVHQRGLVLIHSAPNPGASNHPELTAVASRTATA
jgi:hypothetical protein